MADFFVCPPMMEGENCLSSLLWGHYPFHEGSTLITWLSPNTITMELRIVAPRRFATSELTFSVNFWISYLLPCNKLPPKLKSLKQKPLYLFTVLWVSNLGSGRLGSSLGLIYGHAGSWHQLEDHLGAGWFRGLQQNGSLLVSSPKRLTGVSMPGDFSGARTGEAPGTSTF